MSILLTTLFVYALGLLLTAVGSRLAGRCTTWCCALLGLPMWVVGGTVAPFCLALPQLMLAFLAAGMSVTALAVGTALAGAVANLGLALAVCLLNRRRYATADRDEFCRKCLLLLAACGVLAVFVRDGELSYTGTGLLMLLFVLFILMSIAFQHNFTYGETIEAVSTSDAVPSSRLATKEYGYTAHTMAFPVMSVRNSLKNLAGVIGGLALLAGGAMALVYSATTLANLTGTIQALWAASLISFGFLPAPAGRSPGTPPGVGLEAVHCAVPLLPAGLAAHPAVEQRYFEPDAGAADFKPDVPPQAARGRAVPQLRGAGLRRHGAGAASAAAVQTQAQALAGRDVHGIVFCLFSRRIVCAESGGVIEKLHDCIFVEL